MSATAAALVLTWLCLILLAFAMAGLLRQVRDLQSDLAELGAQGARPLRGRRVAELAGAPGAILVVDPGCGVCVPVLRAFAGMAASVPDRRFEVLCYRASPDWPDLAGVNVRVDERLYRQLDVPWAPALLTTDADGVVTSARPIDEPDDLRRHLSRPLSEVGSPTW
jgi:hypothetical protein